MAIRALGFIAKKLGMYKTTKNNGNISKILNVLPYVMKRLSGIYKRAIAIIALFSLEIVITWVVFLGSVIVFLFISEEVFLDKEENFDRNIFEWVHNLVSPELTFFMKVVTTLASGTFIFVFSLAISIYFLFIKKHHWYSLRVPVVAIGSAGLNILLKNIFERPRPLLPHLVEAYGMSFPSGHAMISFSF